MAAPTSPTTLIMQAATSDGTEVLLDPSSSMLGQHFTVHFALLYPGSSKASPEDLATAFGKILPSFKVLGGRLVKRTDGNMTVLCNNAGVPLTHVVSTGKAPSFAGPLAAEHFDLVRDHLPEGEEPAKEAPMRVQVTDFVDAQVVAVSMNHGLCDANGIGRFMTAWAAAYRGEASEVAVSHDRITPLLPTPGYGQPPLSSSEGVPEEWRKLRHLAESVPASEDTPFEKPVFASFAKSAAECAKLKECCNTASGDGASVSTNDALCAEVASSLGVKGEHVPISMVMEYRGLVGAQSLFSNLCCGIEILLQNSLAGAGDIRRVMPHAQSREFVEWHLGQAYLGMNPCWKPKLIMNTWVKAFKLSDLKFAGPAEDVVLGLPMLQARLAMKVPYCIALPQKDGGVKAHVILSQAAAQNLMAAGNDVTIVQVSS